MKIFIFTLFIAGFHYGSAALEKAECNYFEDPYEGYICELHLTNPNGLDNFIAIDGTHLPGYGNNDVVRVERNPASYTTNIPSIICNTFRNLKNFDFSHDFIAEISDTSLRNCPALEVVALSDNNIRRISADAFRYNPNLWMVYLTHNYITDLPRNLFTSLPNLRYVMLDGNSLEVIHSDTFGVNPSFTNFYLNRNSISAFDVRLVDNTGLRSIEFTGNSCASVDVFDETQNRDDIRAALAVCFNNYRDRY